MVHQCCSYHHGEDLGHQLHCAQYEEAYRSMANQPPHHGHSGKNIYLFSCGTCFASIEKTNELITGVDPPIVLNKGLYTTAEIGNVSQK